MNKRIMPLRQKKRVLFSIWLVLILGPASIWGCASQGQPPKADSSGPANSYAEQLEQAKAAAHSSLLKTRLNFSSLSDLHYAAGWGSLQLAEHILQRDGQVDVRDSGNRTPLFLAAGFNNSEMLGFLLSKGAELEAKNKFGSRPIHMAAGFNEDVQVLVTLVEAGADVNEANELGSTPLHWAAGSAALPQSKLLLENGAQARTEDKFGKSPLQVAQQPPRQLSAEARSAEVALLQEAQKR